MTFFVVLAGLFIWFLYIDRAILTPFVLAAIFAYVFNPIVNFLYLKVKLPRTFSILIIYLLIMSLVVTLSIFSTRRILSESLEFNQFISKTVNITKTQINSLPDYIKPTAKEALIS